MTRINSAINPKNLTDQHLIAELRELPRIFTAVNKRIEQGKFFDDIPKEFTLGEGHVKFFYNKLLFLSSRHLLLRCEYFSRFEKEWQFKIEVRLFPHQYGLVGLWNSYKSTEKEKQLLIDRISTRINESNQIPRYYGEKITKEQAIQILNQ